MVQKLRGGIIIKGYNVTCDGDDGVALKVKKRGARHGYGTIKIRLTFWSLQNVQYVNFNFCIIACNEGHGGEIQTEDCYSHW